MLEPPRFGNPLSAGEARHKPSDGTTCRRRYTAISTSSEEVEHGPRVVKRRGHEPPELHYGPMTLLARGRSPQSCSNMAQDRYDTIRFAQ